MTIVLEPPVRPPPEVDALETPPVEVASPPSRRLLFDHRWLLAISAVLGAAAIVHLAGMSSSPARVDDEGTYVAQAWAVQTGRGLAHYTYWYDHPPLGWSQIAAWTWLTDAFGRAPNAIAAGREAMLVAKMASCVLVYVLARRLGMTKPFAMAALALFAFSPLALDFQRRVFLDNVATPWLLAAFVLALSPQRSLAAAAGSALAFAIAALSKETTLVFLPALVLQLWQHSDARTRRFVMTLSMTLTALTLSMYGLYALLKGELVPGDGHVSLFTAIHWQLSAREGSGSILDASSGVRGLLRTWLDLDPWLLTGAVVALPLALWTRRLRPVGLAFAIQGLMLARGGYVPFPFVIASLPFAALLVAGALDELWGRANVGDARTARAGALPLARLWPRVPPSPVLGRLAVAATAAVGLLVVAPAWATGDQDQMTVRRDTPMQQAQLWIEDNVARDATVVVDDALWLDLVRAGFDERRVIWFYKLDLDPGVRLPNGWWDVDYVALGEVQGTSMGQMPKLRTVLSHSRTIATFGEGPDSVSIYEVEPP